MHQRKFLSSVLFLILVNIIIKPFWILGVERKVQLIVGAEQYGLYFSLFNLSFILNIFLDAGITIFNTRTVASNSNSLNNQFANLFVIKFGLAIIYFILAFILGAFLGFDHFHFILLCFVCINQFLLSFITFFRSNIIALQKNYLDGFFSIFDKLLMIIITLFYLISSPENFTIIHFACIQTIALSISFITGWIILFTIFKVKFKAIDLSQVKSLMTQAAPFAMLTLLMSIYLRIDALMLERMLPDGANQTGIYAGSYRILEALSNVLILFGTTLLPLFANNIGNYTVLRQISKLSMIIITVISGFIVLLSWFYASEIIQLLYGNQSPNWIETFKYLMIGIVGMCMVYIYGTLLTAAGKIKLLNLIVLTGVFINIFLNYIFIPKFGASGCAIAFAVTQSIMGIVHFYFGLNWLNKEKV